MSIVSILWRHICASSYEDARHERVQVFYTAKYGCFWFVCRRLHENQVIDIFDDARGFERADTFIEPPPVDCMTNENSGEEDWECEIHYLNDRQLAACAKANIIYSDRTQRLGKMPYDSVSSVSMIFQKYVSNSVMEAWWFIDLFCMFVAVCFCIPSAHARTRVCIYVCACV